MSWQPYFDIYLPESVNLVDCMWVLYFTTYSDVDCIRRYFLFFINVIVKHTRSYSSYYCTTFR